jgi:hypothetical protein
VVESEVKSRRFGLGSGCGVKGDNLSLEIPWVEFSLEHWWTPLSCALSGRIGGLAAAGVEQMPGPSCLE